MVGTRGSDRERSSPPRGSRAGRPHTRSRDATTERSEEHRAEDSGASEQSQMIRRLSEELSHVQEERQQAREERQQAREERQVMMEALRSMSVELARLQKRPVDDSPPVPPEPSPPTVQFTVPEQPPVAPTTGPRPMEPMVMPPAVGSYVIPPPGMPTGSVVQPQGVTTTGSPTTGQREQSTQRFEQGGPSSGPSHSEGKWDVDRFLKNGGVLFFGEPGVDPEVALSWFDDTEVVLEHMGCPAELWVRVVGGAIRGHARTWWRSILARRFRGRSTEEIRWEEFREVFFSHFFSETVIEEKKIEFLALEQGDVTVAEYHARFIALERFAPGSFPTERQRAARFVRGLRLSLQSAVSMFQCSTLEEAVARALEGEASHRIHHRRRAQQLGAQPLSQFR